MKFRNNTEVCIDMKTKLREDARMVSGKEYQGVLRRDCDSPEYGFNGDHFTFIETVPFSCGKRNPRVFEGKFITITRRGDGQLRPNFRPLQVGSGFQSVCYALGVYRELCFALSGLVEEGGTPV